MIEKQSRIQIVRKINFKFQSVFTHEKSRRAIIQFFILPPSTLSTAYLQEHIVCRKT